MKKLLMLLSILGVMAFAVSCGDDEEETNDDKTTPATTATAPATTATTPATTATTPATTATQPVVKRQGDVRCVKGDDSYNPEVGKSCPEGYETVKVQVPAL